MAFVLYLRLFYQPLRLLARTSEGFQEATTGSSAPLHKEIRRPQAQ